MSRHDCPPPDATSTASHLVLDPKEHDIGAFSVRRLLPSQHRRFVGPFVFFDEMGPAVLAPGAAMDVRPHPHIGLATLTWLFEGAVMHRDSLGCVQEIRPGATNLMVAGSGIVHSERSPREGLGTERRLHGIQTWLALPAGEEEREPSFHHVPADALPSVALDGGAARVAVGAAWGVEAPTPTFTRTLFAEVRLDAGVELPLPDVEELAVYVVRGALDVGDVTVAARQMVVLDGRPRCVARGETLLAVLGGEPLDGDRRLWWNFVATDKAKIEAAKERWRAQEFAPVPGETEWIPLPE